MAELALTVRTPHGVVVEAQVFAARVPTETGQVGLRPRGEPLVLAVVPGLVVLRTAAGTGFVATGGGLLESSARSAVLYTPFAAQGDTAARVMDALAATFSAPDSELAARRRLDELEQRIVQELRRRPAVSRTGERP